MRRRHQVIVAPRAVAQLDRIAEWWRANRPEAPELFPDEFGVYYATAGDPDRVTVLADWHTARGSQPRL